MGNDGSPALLRRDGAATARAFAPLQHGDPLNLCMEAATELAPALARRVLARVGLALLQDAARTRDPERLKRLLF